jgi:hypothetical protein
VEELHLEGKLFTAPQRALGPEPDRAILIVIDVGKIVGKLLARRLVRLAGKVARHLPDHRSVERRGLGVGRRQKAGRYAGHQRQRGSSEEIPAIHETTSRLQRRSSPTQCTPDSSSRGTELLFFPDVPLN